MILLAGLLNSLSVVLGIIFQTLIILIVARAILSWVNPDPYNPIVRFINGVTDPLMELLQPLRRYMAPLTGRIDLTPLVLILIIIFLQHFLVQVLADYALQLRRAAM